MDQILHFPMSDVFNNPLKLLHVEKKAQDYGYILEINHWRHKHPLILNVEPQVNNLLDIGCNDPVEVCYGCVRPLSFRYYSCKDGCLFVLHKYCAELPPTLEHQLLINHSSHLVNTGFRETCYSGGMNHSFHLVNIGYGKTY